MTTDVERRVGRLEAVAGLRLPHGRPLEEWSDADLCTLLGVPVDVSDDELRAIVEAETGTLTET